MKFFTHRHFRWVLALGIILVPTWNLTVLRADEPPKATGTSAQGTAPVPHDKPESKGKATPAPGPQGETITDCFSTAQEDPRVFQHSGLDEVLNLLDANRDHQGALLRNHQILKLMPSELEALVEKMKFSELQDWSIFLAQEIKSEGLLPKLLPAAETLQRLVDERLLGLLTAADEKKPAAAPDFPHFKADEDGVLHAEWSTSLTNKSALNREAMKALADLQLPLDAKAGVGLSSWRSWLESKDHLTKLKSSSLSYYQAEIIREQLLSKFEEESSHGLKLDETNPKLGLNVVIPPLKDAEARKAALHERILLCNESQPADPKATPKTSLLEIIQSLSGLVSEYHIKNKISEGRGLPLQIRVKIETRIAAHPELGTRLHALVASATTAKEQLALIRLLYTDFTEAQLAHLEDDTLFHELVKRPAPIAAQEGKPAQPTPFYQKIRDTLNHTEPSIDLPESDADAMQMAPYYASRVAQALAKEENDLIKSNPTRLQALYQLAGMLSGTKDTPGVIAANVSARVHGYPSKLRTQFLDSIEQDLTKRRAEGLRYSDLAEIRHQFQRAGRPLSDSEEAQLRGFADADFKQVQAMFHACVEHTPYLLPALKLGDKGWALDPAKMKVFGVLPVPAELSKEQKDHLTAENVALAQSALQKLTQNGTFPTRADLIAYFNPAALAHTGKSFDKHLCGMSGCKPEDFKQAPTPADLGAAVRLVEVQRYANQNLERLQSLHLLPPNGFVGTDGAAPEGVSGPALSSSSVSAMWRMKPLAKPPRSTLSIPNAVSGTPAPSQTAGARAVSGSSRRSQPAPGNRAETTGRDR